MPESYDKKVKIIIYDNDNNKLLDEIASLAIHAKVRYLIDSYYYLM